MPRRVLHLLTQRPHLTGSGVTLDALVRRAADADWDQAVAVGVPASAEPPTVGGLPAQKIAPLGFETPDLPFPVPGMSDQMPYRSSVFSVMTDDQIAAYMAAWKRHIRSLCEHFRPDVVHAHHLWLIGSAIRDWCDAPVVSHCHGTGLRQLALCPSLADRVANGCARNGRIAVLHAEQKQQVTYALAIDPARVRIVGAGYRDDLFRVHAAIERNPHAIAYAGKLAAAKGLPWLLDAVERIGRRQPILLHVAGGGDGQDASALRARMGELGSLVRYHGPVNQAKLAEILAQCTIFALPSLYEGLPLVLIEALACGCRLVATALPGIVDGIADAAGDALTMIPLPRLENVNQPIADDQPAFVAKIEAALTAALGQGPIPTAALAERTAPYTWNAVFARVEALWRELIT